MPETSTPIEPVTTTIFKEETTINTGAPTTIPETTTIITTTTIQPTTQVTTQPIEDEPETDVGENPSEPGSAGNYSYKIYTCTFLPIGYIYAILIIYDIINFRWQFSEESICKGQHSDSIYQR